MTRTQQEFLLNNIIKEYQELQGLEQGVWPAWCSSTQQEPTVPLGQRQMHADWCLKAVLTALLPVLPRSVRQLVRACLDLRTRMSSLEYITRYYEEQKKASPACLAAQDSL